MKHVNRSTKVSLYLVLSLLVGMTMYIPTHLFAEDTEGTLTDDTYVFQYSPTENFGGDNDLQIRGGTDTRAKNTYVMFTVSGVSGTVNTATLSMYSEDVNQSVTAKSVSSNNWDEGGVTWNNAPAMGSTLDTKSVGSTEWVDFDVTSAVLGSGTYTFGLVGVQNNNALNFYSKEYSSGTYKAKLSINYTPSQTAPSAPSNLDATAIAHNQIDLSWTDNADNETGFKIESKEGSGGTYSQIDTVGENQTTYSDFSVEEETTYYYRVRAYNSYGDSNYSNEDYAVTPSKPTPPSMTEMTVMDEQFSWVSTGDICTALGGVGSREVIRQSSTTNYKWGGYNAATSGSSDIAALTGTLRFQDSASDSANLVDSYVYTIFSSNGTSTPTHYVNLSSVGATFKFMVLNDSSDQAVRWLIRDEYGDWYISENQTPSDRIPIKDSNIPDLGRAYVVPWYTWLHVAGANEVEMNQLDDDGDMALSVGSAANPDLLKITGVGIYISRSDQGAEFELDWFKLWKYEPVAPACPEYSSHEINTRVGMMVGFSQWGGGASGEVRLNSGGNMNAAGWGKAWLSAFRSKLHGGNYNPTQGGRDESYGACTEMWYETSSTGGGLTRVEYGPFQVATMGQWDNTQYNDLTPWWYESGDADGLAETGYSEKDEIMTEFWMEGFYEDVSNIITDQTVSSIRLYQQYDYLDAPHAILQYDAVLDWEYSIQDISSYISGDQTSTHLDPSSNLWFYGFRTNRNVCSYNHVWYPTDQGGWEKYALNTLLEWKYPTTPQYYAMLVTGTSDTDDAICLYYPSWSTFNQYNVAGVNNSTGQVVYQENRMQTTDGTHPDWRAAWRQGADSMNEWDEEYPGCEGTRNMNKIDFAIHPSGVLAPENGLEGCHERVRYEAFFIFGEAGDIKDAIAEIDSYFGPSDTTPPAAPTGLAATGGTNQITLDWNDNTEGDLDGYNVYRSTTTGTGYSKINGSLVSASDYTDSTVSNNTTYYYVVTAVDTSSNESDYSNEDSAASAGDTTAPANPTGLAATAGDGEVSLDWNDNTEGDLDGYNVYRSTTTGTGYSKINGSLVSASAYTDSTASNGTTYYYVVTAVDTSSNESGYSNEDSALPQSNDIYVYDITMGGYETKTNYYCATATVWIKDQGSNDIEGATVYGSWSGATTKGDDEMDTGSNGKATLTSDDVKGGGTFTFTVTDVTATGYTYNSSLNNEDYDSITVP